MNPRAFSLAPLFLILFSLLLCPTMASAQVILDPGAKEEKKEKKDKKKKKRDKKKKKKKKKKKSCPEGQEITEDTAGNCCWAGQSWNGERCVGEPATCPEGFVADAKEQACVLPACTAGKVRTSDEVHCCWPEQAWSKSKSACIGMPACPEGTVAIDQTCDPDPDGDQVLATADLCPDISEDLDQHQDQDGCPDPDNDGDGLCDAWASQDPAFAEICMGLDACPEVAAQTADGCVATVIEDEEPGGGPSTWGWVALGGGALLGATGLTLHFLAESDRNELKDQLAEEDVVQALTRAEAIQRQEDADSLDTTGAILTGLGAAAMIAGGVILATTWDEEAPAASAAILPNGDFLVTLGSRF